MTHITIILLISLLSAHTVKSVVASSNKLDYRKLQLSAVPSILMDANATNLITKGIYSNNRFKKIEKNDFDILGVFKNMKYIFFDNNHITDVEADTFSRLPKLKHIELSRNNLSEVSDVFYNELRKLEHLQYVNLKRNPIRDFNNVYALIDVGLDIDFDGMMLKNRKKRVASASNKITSLNIDHDKVDDSNESLKEEHDNKNITDRPRKAFVRDNKKIDTIHLADKNDLNTKYRNSIAFNLTAAAIVLVALPVTMVIYYLAHRRRREYL